MGEAVGQNQRRQGRWSVALAALIVALTVVAAHRPVLKAQAFLFDDDQYLVENKLVQHPSWVSVKRFITEVLEPSTVRGYYQPLAMISLMLDCAMGGRVDNLRIFHRTSLLLHAANCVLVLFFLYLLFGKLWPAVIAALLYGLHPMTIEAVAWISERKTLLATFFALWSLVFYILYVRRQRLLFYPAVTAAYLLSLLSKPTTIAVPVLLLLLDYWPLRRFGKRAIIEKLPLFLIAGLSAVVTYISQSRTSIARLPGQTGLARLALIFCHNIIFYLYNLVWPRDLSWYYPFPQPFDLSNRWVLLTVIGTVVLLALLAVSLLRTRAVLVGWLFFFFAILPTMGVIGFHPVIAADRHMYLPMLGFFITVTYFLGLLYNTGGARRLFYYALPAVALLPAAGAEFALTRSYLEYWRDSESVYRYMLKSAPNVTVLHNNLANILGDTGRLREAVEHFEISLELKPGSAEVHNNLANVLADLGETDQALEHYRIALKLKPRFAVAHYNLAFLLEKLGKKQQAIEHYRKAVEIKPDYTRAWVQLGSLLEQTGRLDDAVDCYRRAIKLDPDCIIAHGRLGLVLARLGKIEDAIEQCGIVLKARPNDYEMHFNIAYLLELQGRTEEAIRHYKTAVEIKPDYDRARRRLQAFPAEKQK